MRAMIILLLGTSTLGAQEIIARPDAFKTLVNPNCSHCKDEAKRRAGELKDDDRVLCWIRGYSEGGAIPYRFFLNPYRVISDTYGVFVHDPDAGYARGFAASLDFTFHGWRGGVMVMKHKDGTLFSCLSGVAFDGPRKGERLKAVPTLVSTWGYWMAHYPNAVAYEMFDKYQPVNVPIEPNADALKSRGPVDPRLPEDTPVLGVSIGDGARAYRLDTIAKHGILVDQQGREPCVILWHGPTKTAAAYRPYASLPKSKAEPRPVTMLRDDKVPAAPFVDKETLSRWDVAGRAVAGELKGFTLQWLDGTQVKWFAWAADYPKTTVYEPKLKAPGEPGASATGGQNPKVNPGEPGASATGGQNPKVNAAIKEIAGTAEFLRAVPKKFALLKAVDLEKHTATLLCEGEKDAKTWPLTIDAEVKVKGWWGRLDELPTDGRVWVWFKVNRARAPVGVFMLADETSEKEMHGATQFEDARNLQREKLLKRWTEEGLPGSVTFTHLSGELDYTLDHEAMRWGRSLEAGNVVHLQVTPPIKAVVKYVEPWRERTRLRLVVDGFDLADLAIGDRVKLKMTAPAQDVFADPFPPGLDAPRTKEQRIEWFLANIYCTCTIGGDGCTGDFYTLASCNPNGCGAPKATRQLLAGKIDRGQTDRQILEELLKQRGPRLLRPHLLK